MNDEQAALKDVLAKLAPYVAPGTKVPGFGDPEGDSLVVATALLIAAFVQGTAVLALSSTEHPAGAIPNARSLAEAYAEFDYLLADEAQRSTRANAAFIFALTQLLAYQEKWDPGSADVDSLKKELAEHKANSPAAAASLPGGNFWTPLGRAALLDLAMSKLPSIKGGTVGPEQGKRLYKLLSWDEHHVMALWLHVDLAKDSPTGGTIRKHDAPADAARFLPHLAVGLLTRMLATYVLLLDAFQAK